jgi:hypothetical protein
MHENMHMKFLKYHLNIIKTPKYALKTLTIK